MLGLSNLKVGEKKSERNKKSVHDLSGTKCWVRSADGIPRGPLASPAAGARPGPGADRASASLPEELRFGGVWGLAPRGGQAEKRRQVPEGSTLPSFTPSPSAVP